MHLGTQNRLYRIYSQKTKQVSLTKYSLFHESVFPLSQNGEENVQLENGLYEQQPDTANEDFEPAQGAGVQLARALLRHLKAKNRPCQTNWSVNRYQKV